MPQVSKIDFANHFMSIFFKSLDYRIRICGEAGAGKSTFLHTVAGDETAIDPSKEVLHVKRKWGRKQTRFTFTVTTINDDSMPKLPRLRFNYELAFVLCPLDRPMDDERVRRIMNMVYNASRFAQSFYILGTKKDQVQNVDQLVVEWTEVLKDAYAQVLPVNCLDVNDIQSLIERCMEESPIISKSKRWKMSQMRLK